MEEVQIDLGLLENLDGYDEPMVIAARQLVARHRVEHPGEPDPVTAWWDKATDNGMLRASPEVFSQLMHQLMGDEQPT